MWIRPKTFILHSRILWVCSLKNYFEILCSESDTLKPLEQGRYDVCCPMMSAWDLHKAFPEADFKVRTRISYLFCWRCDFTCWGCRMEWYLALNSYLQQAAISLRISVFSVSCSFCICMRSPNFGDYSYHFYILLLNGQITLLFWSGCFRCWAFSQRTRNSSWTCGCKWEAEKPFKELTLKTRVSMQLQCLTTFLNCRGIHVDMLWHPS